MLKGYRMQKEEEEEEETSTRGQMSKFKGESKCSSSKREKNEVRKSHQERIKSHPVFLPSSLR